MSSLKYYFDAHLPTAVATQLRNKGVDVLRCQDIGLTQAGDPQHLEMATQQNRVLVTHDADFLRYHDEWQQDGKSHAGIMRLAPDLQGYPNIGRVVRVLLEYYEMIENGAGNLEDDVVNHLFYISG